MVPSIVLTGCSMETSAMTLSILTDTLQSSSELLDFVKGSEKSLFLEEKIKELMILIYRGISLIVYTPAFLFNNDFFKEMVRLFSGLSISLVTLACMFEGFKRILGIDGTPIKQMIIRLPIMIAVCGFAPIGFVKAVEMMNEITTIIFKLGTGMLESSMPNSSLWEIALFGDVIETFGFILFILLYIALLIPMVLNHGRRWFSMISLGILTPFAMLGYVFESFKNFHQTWWTNLKGLFLVQIIYAVFATILSLVMFALPFPATVEGVFAKLLVILGGLYTLAIPPPFVKRFFDKGPEPNRSYAVFAKKLGKVMIWKKT